MLSLAYGGPNPNELILDDIIRKLNVKTERFVTYNNQVIDLEHVRWLDGLNNEKGCWVILDCTTWNNDGDFWDNAPYIQSDVAEEFKQAWIAYHTQKKN